MPDQNPENAGVVPASPTKHSALAAQAEAARARAAKFLGDRHFSAARKSLEEADRIEAESIVGLGPVDKAIDIVNFHSKLAGAVGLLPGNLLNFAAVFAVQVTMVWKICNVFGHRESKERIRGVLFSMLGSIVPGAVGHTTGLLMVLFSAVVAGIAVYFVATPILAYSLTDALGNAFVMHLESGGTLLTFNAKKFGDHFFREFQSANGKLAPA